MDRNESGNYHPVCVSSGALTRRSKIKTARKHDNNLIKLHNEISKPDDLLLKIIISNEF